MLVDGVVSLRDPFYDVGGAEAELTVEMRLAAQAITMKFAPAFRVAIWANYQVNVEIQERQIWAVCDVG